MNRYLNSTILKTESGKRYYSSIIYPEVTPKDSDLYIITTMGDRLDLIANDYYGDVTLWPILYFANNNAGLNRYSIFVPVGIQLRIPDPNNISDILNQLETINKSR